MLKSARWNMWPLLLASAVAHSADLPLINPGFEDPTSGDNVPGWIKGQHAGKLAYQIGIDTQTQRSGKASLRIRRIEPQVYGSVEQRVALVGQDGKTLEFSARLKTQDVGTQGWVMAITFNASYGSIDQVRSRPLSGSNVWKPVTLRATVPKGTTSLQVALILLDDGTAWADDLKLRTID
jgi:hypothetical protein